MRLQAQRSCRATAALPPPRARPRRQGARGWRAARPRPHLGGGHAGDDVQCIREGLAKRGEMDRADGGIFRKIGSAHFSTQGEASPPQTQTRRTSPPAWPPRRGCPRGRRQQDGAAQGVRKFVSLSVQPHKRGVHPHPPPVAASAAAAPTGRPSWLAGRRTWRRPLRQLQGGAMRERQEGAAAEAAGQGGTTQRVPLQPQAHMSSAPTPTVGSHPPSCARRPVPCRPATPRRRSLRRRQTARGAARQSRHRARCHRVGLQQAPQPPTPLCH